MALNSSGLISIGGLTTGQSIQLELGMSGTQIASLNDSNFRTLSNILSGAISLNNFYGKSSFSGFISYVDMGINWGGACSHIDSIVVDSAENIYVLICETDNSTDEIMNGFIVKINSEGYVLMCRYQFPARQNLILNSITEKLYINNLNNTHFIKMNSDLSGAQKITTTDTSYIYDIAIDSSGILYKLLKTGGYLAICKNTNDGTMDWTRRLNSTLNTVVPGGINVNSYNEIYVLAWGSQNSYGGYDIYLLKYDTSGVIQWENQIGSVNNDIVFSNINGIVDAKPVFDDIGNIYIHFSHTSQTVMKLNSTGTIIWQKDFLVNSSNVSITTMLYHDNFIYILFDKTLIKIDTDSIIYYEKTFSHNILDMYIKDNSLYLVFTITDINVYEDYLNELSEMVNTNSKISAIAKIPIDGSKIGSFDPPAPITISAYSTFTISNTTTVSKSDASHSIKNLVLTESALSRDESINTTDTFTNFTPSLSTKTII